MSGEGVFEKDWLLRQANRLDEATVTLQNPEAWDHGGWAAQYVVSDWHAVDSAQSELDAMRRLSAQPAGFSPERYAYYIRGRPVVVLGGKGLPFAGS